MFIEECNLPLQPSPTVYLALGSNLGGRLANLETSMRELSAEFELEKISPVYETPPWGYEQQPAFLNQVISGKTSLSPQNLLKFVKEIEHKMGRQETFRNGPRVIDIDILVYGDLRFNTPNLVIPHPRMAERAFVLVPLVDIAPSLLIPGQKFSTSVLLRTLDRSGINKFNTEIDTG